MTTPPAQPFRVLLVGHCRPDAVFLKTVVERAIPGAIVEKANDDQSLARGGAAGADLLLVNRILDGEFADDAGLELVRFLIAARVDGPARPIVMLISNFEHAQAEAVALGAAPGFGKSNAYSPQATQHLRAAVGLS